MKRFGVALFGALLLAACGGGANNPANSSDESKPFVMPAKPSMTVAINEYIPYKKGAPIARNIQAECALNKQLSEYIQNYGGELNLAVNRAQGVNDKQRGKALVVEIDEAVSAGNAFIGHRKYVKVSGTLYDNSKKVASFTGARFSGGGMWGGFKGACEVLERTVNTLGRDIAQWLVSPVDGVHLGDGI